MIKILIDLQGLRDNLKQHKAQLNLHMLINSDIRSSSAIFTTYFKSRKSLHRKFIVQDNIPSIVTKQENEWLITLPSPDQIKQVMFEMHDDASDQIKQVIFEIHDDTMIISINFSRRWWIFICQWISSRLRGHVGSSLISFFFIFLGIQSSTTCIYFTFYFLFIYM